MSSRLSCGALALQSELLDAKDKVRVVKCGANQHGRIAIVLSISFLQARVSSLSQGIRLCAFVKPEA